MAPAQTAERQADMSGSGNEKTSKPRHRASVACIACRERRTRCVVYTGERSCTQCMNTGQECIVKNDDQRRKPVSKAHVNLLEDRINQLETALREKEEEPRSADQQQNNGQAISHTRENVSQNAQSESTAVALPNLPGSEPTFPRHRVESAGDPYSLQDSTAGPGSSSCRKSPMVHKLLSTRGHVSFDHLAGRLRYFGPTTNCHIYSDIAGESEESHRQAKEQERRTQRVLSSLSHATRDYLMDLFWQDYNSAIHVIHRVAFEKGRDAGGGPFYSGFLHICILAAGCRFADKQRPDMRGIMLPGRESTLHREAKYMLDYEIERPGGIPSIGALLLLGDLEVGCGRDNAGWLYSGMAYRLCFDVGLHLDRSGPGVSQEDIEIDRMTLWACVVFDRYWSLFLGRPTALKPDDLEVYELSRQFDRLGTSQPVGPEKSLETKIYQKLFEIMELAGKITNTVENVSSRSANLDRLAYLRMAALDSELGEWYARLPVELQYTAENVKTAPFSFFLLHQQYYSTMIMLHRPFAAYEDILDGTSHCKTNDGDSIEAASRLSIISRETCTTCASRIAQIFWQHRRRFDTRKIFVTGLQHAGNAAIALVAAITSSRDRVANEKNMRYLECLTAVLKDMSETYQPAERMATTFNVALLELKDLQPARNSPSLVPARRGSSADYEDETDYVSSKRGPSNRPRANAQPRQSMPSPAEQFRRPLKDILPSPPPTSQSTSDKISGYGVTDEDFVVTAGDMSNIDDSWPILSESDPFAIEDDMAGHSSPPVFRSAWASGETPSYSRLARESNVRFMDLLEDSGGSVQGREISGGDNSMPLISGSGADTGSSGMTGLSQSGVRYSDLGSSSFSDRIRGDQPADWKPSSADARNTEILTRPDNIWTEIIS